MEKKQLIVIEMKSNKDIKKCFVTMQELRPHLNNINKFIEQIKRQHSQGYQLVAGLIDDNVAACIGYRSFTTLAWGKILYIDDLITNNSYKGNSYGKELLNYAINYARAISCDQVHLDTGFHRYNAHKLYLKMGFQLSSHHMSLSLDSRIAKNSK